MDGNMFMSHNSNRVFVSAIATAAFVYGMAACSHVAFTHAPPGTSVETALAKKATVIPTPAPKAAYTPAPGTGLPSVVHENTTESVADYFTLGNLMMQEEKYAEAIKAYENAVRLDPTFSEAWNHLAICYQNTGQNDKAIEAFKKYKAISQQQ